MARDDWRIRVELEEESHAGDLLARLGFELGSEASELARALEARRLVVSRDAHVVFVYTASGMEAEQARAIVEAELRELELEASELRIEHWLTEEESWHPTGEPSGSPDPSPGPLRGQAAAQPDDETWEEDMLARGYAPWEVRVECESVADARRLAETLEREGYGVARGFRYVVAGTETREDARRLAERLHGQVEPGGELVWEVTPQNPFAVFGGLGT